MGDVVLVEQFWVFRTVLEEPQQQWRAKRNKNVRLSFTHAYRPTETTMSTQASQAGERATLRQWNPPAFSATIDTTCHGKARPATAAPLAADAGTQHVEPRRQSRHQHQHQHQHQHRRQRQRLHRHRRKSQTPRHRDTPCWRVRQPSETQGTKTRCVSSRHRRTGPPCGAPSAASQKRCSSTGGAVAHDGRQQTRRGQLERRFCSPHSMPRGGNSPRRRSQCRTPRSTQPRLRHGSTCNTCSRVSVQVRRENSNICERVACGTPGDTRRTSACSSHGRAWREPAENDPRSSTWQRA